MHSKVRQRGEQKADGGGVNKKVVSLRIPPTLPEPRLRFWKVSAPASDLAKLHFFGRFFADVGGVGRLRVGTLIF